MPAAPAKRPTPVISASGPSVPDAATERAIEDVRIALGRVAASVKAFDAVSFDLVAGLNRVPHKLGRRCTAAVVSPSTVAADFAYAASDQNANNAPDRFVLVTCTGTAQPRAVVLVF